jgi:hypothetical protein
MDLFEGYRLQADFLTHRSLICSELKKKFEPTSQHRETLPMFSQNWQSVEAGASRRPTVATINICT